MKKIVFVAGNSDTQLKSIFPVIKHLSKINNISISVIFTANFPILSDIKKDDFFIKNIKKLVNDFYIYKPIRTTNDKFSFIQSYNICKHFQINISKYLKSLIPDLVILPNNKIFRNRFISKYAALNNIHTLVVQDTLNPGGFGNLKSYTKPVRRKLLINNFFNFLLNSIGMVHIAGLKAVFKYNKGHRAINFIGVWGEASKTIAISNKYNSKQICITGQPRFDIIVNKNWNHSTKKISTDLGVQVEHKKIVFLPTKGITSEYFLTRDEQINIYTEMIESIERISKEVDISIDLIIKLHRDENLNTFKKVLPASLLRFVSIAQGDLLYPILNGCDLAITTASTAGLEALLFDKPLITINFGGRPDFYNYASMGAAIGVYKTEEFEVAIRHGLFDTNTINSLQVNRSEYVKKEAYIQDGKSAERSAFLITNLLESPNIGH